MLEFGEYAPPLRQFLGRCLGVFFNKAHDFFRKRDGFFRIIGDLQFIQYIREPHQSKANFPCLLRHFSDLGKRIVIHADHIVQKMHGNRDHFFQPVKVKRISAVLFPHELV
ncbi:hypothetical protein SDC9_164305 [bioreactor metagenome]|uniref:Uncharacterized protein n=1 Tax=bioreactor metagenome TaxID=1076179 RepID=A0A645FT97_9ZZZZ